MNTPTRGNEPKPAGGERDVVLAQSEFTAAQIASADTFETIHVRAETVTLVLKEVLHVRPPPHWGIND
jgi:hypothetical protein